MWLRITGEVVGAGIQHGISWEMMLTLNISLLLAGTRCTQGGDIPAMFYSNQNEASSADPRTLGILACMRGENPQASLSKLTKDFKEHLFVDDPKNYVCSPDYLLACHAQMPTWHSPWDVSSSLTMTQLKKNTWFFYPLSNLLLTPTFLIQENDHPPPTCSYLLFFLHLSTLMWRGISSYLPLLYLSTADSLVLDTIISQGDCLQLGF